MNMPLKAVRAHQCHLLRGPARVHPPLPAPAPARLLDRVRVQAGASTAGVCVYSHAARRARAGADSGRAGAKSACGMKEGEGIRRCASLRGQRGRQGVGDWWGPVGPGRTAVFCAALPSQAAGSVAGAGSAPWEWWGPLGLDARARTRRASLWRPVPSHEPRVRRPERRPGQPPRDPARASCRVSRAAGSADVARRPARSVIRRIRSGPDIWVAGRRSSRD